MLRENFIISVDAMGGSNAPICVIEGISMFIESGKARSVYFKIFGDEFRLMPILQNFPNLLGKYELFHCATSVADDEQPVKALKQGKESSMRKAIDAVKNGHAHACLSSGNTGALMVMSKMVLGSLPCIKRPAIISVFPNLRGGIVMLDLGANTECDEENFFQFAQMGHCYAKILLKKPYPLIGILNVGVEETKGRDVEKKAFNLLKESGFNFYGYVEGNDVTYGLVDVVVTDGFSGNIAIKIAEGTARICKDIIKEAFTSNLISKVGGLLARKSLKKAMDKIDPKNYNGAMLIGLNGVVVKSHGSSDSVGFCNAIFVTYNLIKQDINKDISSTLEEVVKKETLVNKIIHKLGF